ncbi:MAG: ABC transporter substrate-binding protein [Gammaproteobacteria bacterium]|nr:ABC transporter substrate-binding protein [Gammaproteobacteria bacterium]
MRITASRLLAVLAIGTAAAATAAPALRVVTLAPHLAEIVCAAGGCGELAGVSAYTDYPPQAAKVKRIGDAFAVNLEATLAAQPDLVIAWGGGTSPAAVARLRALGLTVRTIDIRRPDDVADAIERVGRWLGTDATAALAAHAYRARLAALRRRYAQTQPIRVFYQIGTAPAYTVSGRSPLAQALTVCRGTDAFAGLGQLAAPVSAEAVARAAPQAVLYGRDDDAAAIARYWARLPQTPAERFGNLYAVDDDLLARPGPRLLDGIARTCAVLDRARRRLPQFSAPNRAAR